MSGNTWAQSALADVTLAWYVGSTPRYLSENKHRRNALGTCGGHDLTAHF